MKAPKRMQVGCRRGRQWARAWRVGLLVILGLLLLIAGDLPVVHDHDEPGLYNEECPLGRLATVSPRASAPDPMPAPGSPAARETFVPTGWVAALPAAVVPTAPRAPPVAV